jgi:hypothetical protein
MLISTMSGRSSPWPHPLCPYAARLKERARLADNKRRDQFRGEEFEVDLNIRIAGMDLLSLS